MIVRRCRNCFQYRYLPEGGLCSDCIEQQKEWVVVAKYGVLRKIYESGLDEDKAKEIADSKSTYYVAIPRDDLGNCINN